MSQQEIECLKKSAWTFGYRELDDLLPTFRKLQKMGLVYETVRAFYITDAGRAALGDKP